MAGLSVYRALLRHPQLASAVNHLLTTLLFSGNKLDVRLRELLIMRIGWTTGAKYEWTQHWHFAERVGLPPEDVIAVRDWRSSTRLGAADRAVLAAVDDTLERGKIFEEQRRLSEAMAEYQKAVDGTRGKTRVQAAESLARLAPQLGKVVLRSLVRGKCQERVQWLLPGKKQKIKVGDQSQPVNVRAGQTVEIGSCS